MFATGPTNSGPTLSQPFKRALTKGLGSALGPPGQRLAGDDRLRVSIIMRQPRERAPDERGRVAGLGVRRLSLH
jgi:hypothetical protein